MLLQLSMLGITLVVLFSFYFATGRNRLATSIFSLWAVLVGTLAYLGFYENSAGADLPPGMATVLLPSVLLVIYLYRKIAIDRVSLPWLVGLHVLRIPVELVLYGLYLEGLVPIIMSFAGWNYDILSGVLALLLLIVFLVKGDLPKSLVYAWSAISMCLLAIILVTAVLSIPSPIQQLAFDQPNIGVLKFPFTLLPGVVVPIVILSHLLILKKIKHA